MWTLRRRDLFRSGMNEVQKKSGPRAAYGFIPGQYRGAGLLQSVIEIGVGRRFWQCNPSAENAHAFYVAGVPAGPKTGGIPLVPDLSRRDKGL